LGAARSEGERVLRSQRLARLSVLLSLAAALSGCGATGEVGAPGTRSGRLVVKGAVASCPLIDGVDVSPTSLVVGRVATLAASIPESDGGAGFEYQWSTTSGVIDNARARVTRLRPTLPGVAVIELRVSRGGCTDAWRVVSTIDLASR
ncbi:MAG TPA: hypothetical protein VHC69_05875, partial [Polyangiaceae bacterium]|nr:hypothetical protein [Polyangiaceae bacterium]